MKNNKNIVQIIFQGLTAVFFATNIVIAAATKGCTLFSYICCHIVAILQSIMIMDMYWEDGKK